MYTTNIDSKVLKQKFRNSFQKVVYAVYAKKTFESVILKRMQVLLGYRRSALEGRGEYWLVPYGRHNI